MIAAQLWRAPAAPLLAPGDFERVSQLPAGWGPAPRAVVLRSARVAKSRRAFRRRGALVEPPVRLSRVVGRPLPALSPVLGYSWVLRSARFATRARRRSPRSTRRHSQRRSWLPL